MREGLRRLFSAYKKGTSQIDEVQICRCGQKVRNFVFTFTKTHRNGTTHILVHREPSQSEENIGMASRTKCQLLVVNEILFSQFHQHFIHKLFM